MITARKKGNLRLRLGIKEGTDIGIIVSVPSEGSRISGKLKEKTKGKSRYFEGKLGGKRVILTISGMGKVNAAHAFTRLILDHAPFCVMNIGVGGAYPSSGLRVGDIAVAGKEIYGDEGILMKDGFHGTDLINIPLLKKGRKKYFNEFPLNKGHAGKIIRTIPLCPPLTKGGWGDFQITKGTFVTVSTCTGTKKRALELERRFKAVCENMEGAAIAHVCAMYDVPCIEMRGISNIVEDRDRSAWNIRLAAENCQKAAMELMKVI
jgi:futalosine hydrolase